VKRENIARHNWTVSQPPVHVCSLSVNQIPFTHTFPCKIAFPVSSCPDETRAAVVIELLYTMDALSLRYCSSGGITRALCFQVARARNFGGRFLRLGYVVRQLSLTVTPVQATVNTLQM